MGRQTQAHHHGENAYRYREPVRRGGPDAVAVRRDPPRPARRLYAHHHAQSDGAPRSSAGPGRHGGLPQPLPPRQRSEASSPQLAIDRNRAHEGLRRPLRQAALHERGRRHASRPHDGALTARNLGNANSHSTENLPILFAGGGFKHGQHLAFDQKNAPLPNLFVSMLQRLGIETDRFASSTGTMTGLEMSAV